MIQKKRKIGFAASEIQNSQFRQRTVGKNVVDNFNKTVYLLVLVVFGLHHLKILGKNAQVYKSGNIFPFLKDVVFCLSKESCCCALAVLLTSLLHFPFLENR